MKHFSNPAVAGSAQRLWPDWRWTVAVSVALSVFGFFLVQPSQFVAPFIFGDDVAWEVDPGFYGNNLRQEGRWFVYGWIRLFGFGSAAFDYVLLVTLWSGAAAVIALAAAGEQRRWLAVLVAVTLSLSPSFWALTMWPHTILPMAVIVAAFVFALAHRLDNAAWLRLLFAAMIATMLSYQLFSFYLLGAVLIAVSFDQLAREDRLSPAGLFRMLCCIVGVGVAGMITGLIVQYSLNASAFGHFGLEEAAWRADEARALKSNSRVALAWANLRLNLQWLGRHIPALWLVVALGIACNVAVLTGCRGLDRRRLLLVTGLLTAVALAPLLTPLATGLIIPADRGALNLWLALVAALAMPVIVLGSPGVVKRISLAALLLLLASTLQGLSTAWTDTDRSHRQQVNRLDKLADMVRTTTIGLSGDRPHIVFLGNTQPYGGIEGLDPWHGEMFIRRRFKGEGNNLSFCRSVASCPALGNRIDVDSIPDFAAAGPVKRLGSLIMVKL